ncbi:uncharacterized protein LOC134337694 [Mobula hypostoma]|uniref:uncharacterized protein LOC134337694 n=1 Tax=Mobula hypostoma TaxID=723540 RepID=UPI002FC3914D
MLLQQECLTSSPGASSTATPSTASTTTPGANSTATPSTASTTTPGVSSPAAPSTASTTTPGTNSTATPINICKTEWFHRDNPSGQGICEDLTSLQKAFPYRICNLPITCEVETASEVPSSQTGENICRCSISTGFYCVYTEKRDGKCNDYRVRFTCTESM